MMKRLTNLLVFSLVLVASMGRAQVQIDAFPLLGTAPDPNDLFLLVDVDPVGGNSTKNVKFSNVTNHTHTESAITDLDKYTQAVVDGLLAGKAATSHTHTESDISDLGAYLTTVTASDMDAEASTDGYVLTSDGAGNAAWEVVSGGGASALDDLVDVTITSPATDEVLSYNGSAWVNASSAGGGGGGSGASPKVLLKEITDPVSGEFSFSSISGDYDRLIIEGQLRSDASVGEDVLYVTYNGDATAGNYDWQETVGINGGEGNGEGNTPRVGAVPGSSAPSNEFADYRIVFENYAGTGRVKGLFSRFSMRYGSGTQSFVGITRQGHRTETDPITSINFAADGGEDLTGTLRLYGERSITVEDSETITVKKAVPVTLTSGEFDVDTSGVGTFDRVIIEGYVRSAVAASFDIMEVIVNGDTTLTNYWSQTVAGDGGGSNFSHINSPDVNNISGASSPADEYAYIKVVLESPQDSNGAHAIVTMANNNTGSNQIGSQTYISTSVTSGITAVKLRTDGGEDLSGTVHAYIEKSGVLPVAQGPHVIETITNASGASFDFQSIPSGYRRIFIKGYVRSAGANTGEAVDVYLNNDTTAANYWNQYQAADNGSQAVVEVANATLGIAPGTSSPAGSHASITAEIEGYDQSKMQVIDGRLSGLRAAAHNYTAKNSISWEDGGATAVTRVTVQSASGMTGTLTLYGEY